MTLLVSVAVALLAIPSAVFVLEIVAALTAPRGRRGADGRSAAAGLGPAATAAAADSARVAVVVPAHDEAAGIAATLATLTPQLRAGDRLLVVADNCSDDTAAIARAAGAEVVERSDAAHAGKGWALAAGVAALAAQPPDIVVIVDADCDVAPGAIAALRDAGRTGPAQAVYLMRAPDDAPRARQLAELLFAVRNWARPLGLAQLGAPCLLTGAGMALPWAIARAAPLGNSSVVEDVQLAIDLAAAGTPARFCPAARVTSFFPSRERAADAQRTRWLWGQLRTMLQAPRLVVAACRQGRMGLLLLACELAVPPLSLLFPLWTLTAAAALATGLTSREWRPFACAVAGSAACALAVVAAWWRFARDRVPLWVVIAAPLFALPTIKSALVALFRRRQRWNRTARD